MNSDTRNWQARRNDRTVRLALWTAAWVTTMAVASFGPSLLWEGTRWLTLIAIAVNLLIGGGMIVANIRHLRALDELMQRVQLEAMGLALGVGVVGGLSYALLDAMDVIAVDAGIAHVVMLMGIVYLTAVVAGVWRYR